LTRTSLATFALTCIGLLLTSSSALSEKLSVNLTTHQVAISSNFTGATITLFGAIQKGDVPLDPAIPYDIIVVVRGPDDDVTVRRKERIAGIWVNRAAVKFTSVPGFYFVASTRPLNEIVSEPLLNRNEIGIERLSLTNYVPESEDLSFKDIAGFRKAIVRQRKANRLYVEAEGDVLLQDNTLFSMRVEIPANVPVGDYVAQVLLVRDGAVIGSQSLRPSVNKTGMERMIYRFAHGSPFFYGLTAVIIAIFAGWLAAVAFRRR
jgi:uncharacterized protein (TIGR02186 family)